MSKSQDNVMEAFAGESQASQKYLAFAKVADKEGHSQVAKLFRAAARAEHIHAQNHLKTTDEIGDTADNLESAANGEAAEFKDMYPGFIKDAQAEGESDVERSFDYANKVEEIHYNLYNKAIEAVKSGDKLPEVPIYVCQFCGNTVEGDAPEKCPVCGAPKKYFQKID